VLKKHVDTSVSDKSMKLGTNVHNKIKIYFFEGDTPHDHVIADVIHFLDINIYFEK
jgi:hypothetical protein